MVKRPEPDDPGFQHERYRRSNGYDPAWIVENQMGPHALWLTEALCEVMDLQPGSRVLDLGCGTAISSIFLAQEFGVEVVAADLWIAAEDNERRVRDAGVADLVTPVHAEAHTLPFEPGRFDAIISIDAYQYFGTSDLYLGYVLEFLRTGGQIGVVSPGTTRELGLEVPNHLEPYWESEFCCFHSADWWRVHWAKTRKVRVDHAEVIAGACDDWLQFNDAIAPYVEGWWVDEVAATHDMLVADANQTLAFPRLVATKL